MESEKAKAGHGFVKATLDTMLETFLCPEDKPRPQSTRRYSPIPRHHQFHQTPERAGPKLTLAGFLWEQVHKGVGVE